MPDRRPLHPPRVVRPNGAEQFEVPPYAVHSRLDAFLARYGDERSRSDWHRLIEQGAVTVDGRLVRPSERVMPGQRIRIDTAATTVRTEIPPAADIPVTIAYEDPAMIVVNKPPGLVVHPAPGHEEGTLVNALVARFPDLSDPSGELRPGIVHRLDKDTSGLLVVGRTTAAMAKLQLQFKERTAQKRYLLLVQGDLAEEEAAIEAPIGRDTRDRKKMTTRAGGREARTQFVVLERYGDYTLVEADLQSGRTHQLRVHFQFIGHPIAGDRTYGNGRGPAGLRRQFVHASYMRIQSPDDGAEREIYAPLPADLRSPLERLRAIRGFSQESMPAAVLAGGGAEPKAGQEDVLVVPGAPGRLGGAPAGARSPSAAGRSADRRPGRGASDARAGGGRSAGSRPSARSPKRGRPR
jgi:23S rRNA pseudouridine1911/1915/1917 synthase